MKDRFQELLAELGHTFHLSLKSDKRGACSILIPPELTIQLQLDGSQEKLFLFTKLAEIPPGKFREEVLREGLKANGLSDPRAGILAYLAVSNHLVLFQNYPVSILNGELLAGLFGSFLEMAESWQRAIQGGQSAPPTTASSPPFGLRS